MANLSQTIDGLQEILAICPCCGEIFRVVEGKFVFPQMPPKQCEYLDLVAFENKIATDGERLDSAEQLFEEKLREQKHELLRQGRKAAKSRLKKIDPVFSGNNIDPQDVKVIFDPVEYIIFHGLSSQDEVECLEFISRAPDSKRKEVTAKSIEMSIDSGNVEFQTLRMNDNGSFDIKKA